MSKEISVILMPKGYGKATKEVRDYIHQLEKENDDLKNRLDNEVAENTLRLKEVEQLENIRKESIDYITSEEYFDLNNHKTGSFVEDSNNYLKAQHILLNILNKGSDKE